MNSRSLRLLALLGAALALVVGLATLWLPGQDLRVVDRSQPLAGAFDPARGRFVTVGWRGETTEFDGSRWLSRPIDPLPVLQTEQRMVHDDARARMILVGGDLATPLLTTRAFDGASWSTLTQNGPPGRQAFALVSDAARSVVVLFGGISFTGPLLDETWIFDG